jgi:cell division topological specificity factor MinE
VLSWIAIVFEGGRRGLRSWYHHLRRRQPARARLYRCGPAARRRRNQDDDPYRKEGVLQQTVRAEGGMNLFRFFQPAGSAPMARERLQTLLEYERKLGSQIDLFAVLREEILAAVSRYVVSPESVQVTVDRGAKFSTLAVEIPNILARPIQRRADQRMVDGKNSRLADEVRYILGRAAKHDGRIVTIGQIILFSTETGDAWLLDPSDQLAARLARDGGPEPFHIEENETTFTIDWKGRYRIEGTAFVYMDQETGRLATIHGYPTHKLHMR